MRRGYKIGLFFVCVIIVVLITILLWKRHTLYKPQESVPQEEGTESQTPYIEKIYEEEDITQAQSIHMKTTCDTICIYENVDKKDGTVSYEEERIPGKYIGMNRIELERALYDDSKNLSLKDKERGFESQHLELFSQEKIIIVRIYDSTPEETGFYIMAVNHEIRVYKKDKTTLYFKTDLHLSDLPETVQQEIIEGKYMDSEIAIYHFLESYSS